MTTTFIHNAARYGIFYSDIAHEMPRLIGAGYTPISVAQAMNLRLHIDELRFSDPVNKENIIRRSDLLTGDGVAYNRDGEALVVPDAQLLREVSMKPGYGLALTPEQWEKLKSNGSVLHYSARELRKFNSKGYTKRRGRFIPENMLVKEVWEHLARETNLEEYVELEGEIKFRNKDEGHFMLLELPLSLRHSSDYAIMESLLLESLDYNHLTFTSLHGAPIYDRSPKGLHRLLIGTAPVKSKKKSV